MSARLTDRLARLVFSHKALWIGLGNFETRRLAKRLDSTAPLRPIYVTGLARAGTTILLEALSHRSDVAYHTYRDYPLLFTPYVWQRLLGYFSKPEKDVAAERAHRDRLMVTPSSPEAMEEIIWMAFFGHLHDPTRSQLLSEAIRFPAFENFYLDHMRKLMLVHGKRRYLSKANYHLTRIPYLSKLLSEATFLVLVRNPVDHIASLMKQDKLFIAEQSADPAKLRHSRYSGHFEFGLDFRPINPGSKNATERVLELRRDGELVRSWAAYWAMLYGYLHRDILENSSSKARVKLIRYEDLCDHPDTVLPSLLAYCELADEGWVARHRTVFTRPTYYEADFTAEERRAIAEETADVAALYGYDT